ncbi:MULTISPECIES: MlaD family protein [unclassified Rhodococcus (in: high G+C Gram-positive bacteria)]|uniref:MlaD family protein n=1 Tax=unclassified Rhodococcus (in: high G+C Gram-positive bacteria) TaxID=192944 RepID=UPI00163A0C6A|nr:MULTISPECIES: MlaD family protein [unclassified Rhodococcus (in: high G+C Gram-positive bacteria)]MBC2641666.1 MCE family protein [Rhodococcus sp. 3A]MBC2893589.1 MCE family protein [Rhodococcus sp. 4CII]
MRSPLVRWQLIGFVLVALAGLVYVGANYVRLDNLLGFGEYTVNLELETSGGIFTNAEVTYRGVPVGRVGEMSLTADGVVVELKIDKSAPDIPASAKAVVANRSAIGEQYVDLQPDTDRGPFLANGSRIAAVDTSTPVPVEELLAGTQGLTESVPIDALHTVVTELGAAFGGRGDDLRSLADSLSGMSESGIESLDRTVALVRDSRTVLETQSEQSSAIEDFSADLDSLADRLRISDPDVRRLIDNANPASEQLGQLVSDVGPGLTTYRANLSVTAKTISAQATALQTLFVYLPGVAAASSTIAPDDGTVHLGLVAETGNPPSCTVGYEGTRAILADMKRQDPNFDDTEQDFPQNTAASCAAPQGSLTGVRSANRIVFGDPATVQPWDSKPKKDPNRLDLNPIANQLAPLLGVTPR